jgi:hypothetical protein
MRRRGGGMSGFSNSNVVGDKEVCSLTLHVRRDADTADRRRLLWPFQGIMNVVGFDRSSVTIRPIRPETFQFIHIVDDLDNPDKWITVIDLDEPIDEKSLEEWLQKSGYKTLSSQTA